MSIRALLLDLSGTLINEGRAVPGAREMLRGLRELGLETFLASNNPFRRDIVKRELDVDADRILHPGNVGGKKGQKPGKFVGAVCSRLGIRPNEILYLGDNITDLTEAVNNNVIFFLAAWSSPTFKYGIPVRKPEGFLNVVTKYFLKESLWYYTVDGQDADGRVVRARALLNPDTTKVTGIQDVLKRGARIPQLEWELSMHLLASVYMEGLHVQPVKPVWSIYPGHDGNTSRVLTRFATMASRLFHEQFLPTLILRHTKAKKSAYARKRGETVPISNQLRTINLDPGSEGRIANRRVLVFDDYTTEAHSFETSRNFLSNAGASDVVGIAVGKYAGNYYAYSPRPGVMWDSFRPAALEEKNFVSVHIPERHDVHALNIFSR
jgi:hypothetical protein